MFGLCVMGSYDIVVDDVFVFVYCMYKVIDGMMGMSFGLVVNDVLLFKLLFV